MNWVDTKRFIHLCTRLGALSLCTGAIVVQAQQTPVTVQVEIMNREAGNQAAADRNVKDDSNVVVWFSPLDSAAPGSAATPPVQSTTQLIMRKRTFEPHILVLQVGSIVQFPNKDPFFHNVFSIFDGKRFDLGLYEAGSTRSIHFDRPGVSFLFCNIHSEMSGVVIAVDTSYFGVSDRSGRVSIPGVPDGRYQMHVWYERSLPEDLKALSRVITISESTRTLESIRVAENPNFTPTHKNKYGQDYVRPPANPAYTPH
jgi:plastocyanin